MAEARFDVKALTNEKESFKTRILLPLTRIQLRNSTSYIDSDRIVRFDSGREQDIENWSQHFTDLHDKIRTLV